MINNKPKGIKIDPSRLQQNIAKSESQITSPKKTEGSEVE